MATYGEILKKVLEDNGVLQRDLAKHAELNESVISLYINHKRSPNLKTHIKICNGLKSLNIEQNFLPYDFS